MYVGKNQYCNMDYMIYCIANHDIVRLSSSVIWTIGTMILMIRDIIHLKKKK